MSSPVVADASPSNSFTGSEAVNIEADVIESNHHLPARTLAEDDQHHESKYASKEDAATMAASEELKHTTISDKVMPSRTEESALEFGVGGRDKDMKEVTKDITPDAEPTDVQDEQMLERISSPKKKRGRDQDDDTRDLEDGSIDASGSVSDGNGSSRTTRLGPEKKRPRDASEDYTNAVEAIETKASTPPKLSTVNSTSTNERKAASESSPKPTFGNGFSDKPQTSSSGFASLAASSTSPFGNIGASKPSVFGSGAQPAFSGFGALAGAKSSNVISLGSTTSTITSLTNKPTTGLNFGGTSSGFGGLGNGSVFGSKLGNGFAGGSGPKLSSFAAPGKESVIASAKPTKAFGAPDSDEDDGSDEDDSEGAVASGEEEIKFPEDKKKTKVTKVQLEDGESGEATLLQLRAKLFALESKEVGWKERGVGTLKINVPQSCISFDNNGTPIPGSFDASGVEDGDEDSKDSTAQKAPRVPRLIMRQENTHRVVLNTIIVRAMEFKDKPAASTAQILFTSFDGGKPTNMLLKMSEANAKAFRSEIESIQHEL